MIYFRFVRMSTIFYFYFLFPFAGFSFCYLFSLSSLLSSFTWNEISGVIILRGNYGVSSLIVLLLYNIFYGTCRYSTPSKKRKMTGISIIIIHHHPSSFLSPQKNATHTTSYPLRRVSFFFPHHPSFSSYSLSPRPLVEYIYIMKTTKKGCNGRRYRIGYIGGMGSQGRRQESIRR